MHWDSASGRRIIDQCIPSALETTSNKTFFLASGFFFFWATDARNGHAEAPNPAGRTCSYLETLVLPGQSPKATAHKANNATLQKQPQGSRTQQHWGKEHNAEHYANINSHRDI